MVFREYNFLKLTVSDLINLYVLELKKILDNLN